MQFLAAYVMRGRMQAITVSAVCAMLAVMLLPLAPLAFVSGAAVGLVTLRIGLMQGLSVLLGAGAAIGLFSWVAVGSPAPGASFILMLWLPVWITAARLRRTGSLARSVRLAVLFGVMLVAMFYLSLEDPAAWWRSAILEMIEASPQGTEIVNAVPDEAVTEVARLATGVVAALLASTVLACLLIARWWQAMLYNSGGFGQEFRDLRLGRDLALATVALIGVASFALGGTSVLAGHLLMLTGLLHSLQGLAVTHGVVHANAANPGWLVGMYLLLLIVPVEMAVTLAVAGLADNWFDFRAHLARRPG